MTWGEFQAEAERLGLQPRIGDEGEWWLYRPEENQDDDDTDYDRFPRFAWNPADDRDAATGHPGFVHVTSHRGTPADALREAARLMRGDVAGKLREWLDEMTGACHGLKMDRQCVRCDHYREVLDKLDELEGK